MESGPNHIAPETLPRRRSPNYCAALRRRKPVSCIARKAGFAGFETLLTAAIVVVAVVAAVVFNQSAIHWRGNIDDDHLFGYYGWRVSQGARPYLDVWDNKPPGIWWINALAFRVFGEGQRGEIVICSAAVASAIAAFAGVARAMYGRSLTLVAALTGCVLLTHIGYECGGNRTETFVLAFETLAILGYVRWLYGGRLGWLAIGAIAGGAAPIFKQSGAAAALACAAHMLAIQCGARLRVGRGSSGRDGEPQASIRGYSRASLSTWGIAGACVSLTPLIAVLVLASQGALREFWFAAFQFNEAYFAINDATWVPIHAAWSNYRIVIPPLYGLMGIAGAGAVWWVLVGVGWVRSDALRAEPVRSGGGDSRLESRSTATSATGGGRYILLWAWLVISVYLSSVGPGRQSYHLMPALAPLGLLALWPVGRLSGERGLLAAMVARPTRTAALVMFGYVLFVLGAGSVDRAAACWAVKPAWHSMQRKTPSDSELRAAEIRALTRPDEKIYVWGWAPGTYRFAYRACVSRFATIEKAGQVGQAARFIVEGAMDDILRERPAVICISPGDYEGLKGDPRREFLAWVERTYTVHASIGGMHVLRLK